MDDALRTELAHRLGMKTREIISAEETDGGLLVTTHDGITTFVERPTALPNAPGPAEAPDDPEPPALEVPDGAAKTVLAWVGGDPERAAAALTAERARPNPRKSLIAELEGATGA